jgi:MFS transporter, MHS family, shikimate and dehydroshikimate transport protein
MDGTMRRVLLASAIGSALEWYDFFIYGAASALVFGELFFPKLDPVTGTLASFATFGVGFFVRPLGGLIFGHFGDRIGRKPVLVITLLLVGVGTFLIGCLPTYATAGLWAPVLLVVLRLVQGLGAGAEYGGAVLFAVEHAPAQRRGLWGSFAPLGVTLGNLLATGVFAACVLLPKADFLAWGWRIPFLLSIVLIGFGLFLRSRVSETPEFRVVAARGRPPRAPVREALRRHPREFLVVLGARLAENGLGYLFPVFTLNYATKDLHIARGAVLTGLTIAYALSLVTIPLFSALSDRVGRRPVYMGAALFCAAFAFPFFMLVETRDPTLIGLGLTIAISIGVAGMFGPQAAYFAELFSTQSRYSGFAFARELGSLLAGGPAPFVAAWLVVWAGGTPWGVAAYVLMLSLATAIALYFGPETHHVALTEDARPAVA